MPEQKNDIFEKPLVVINLGWMASPGIWKPRESRSFELIGNPLAGGDQEMIDILDQLL